jgi:hypothetical protein
LLRRHFVAVALTLPVGSCAIRHYLPERRRQSLSEILTTPARLPAGDFRPAASELAYDALGAHASVVCGRAVARIAREGRGSASIREF